MFINQYFEKIIFGMNILVCHDRVLGEVAFSPQNTQETIIGSIGRSGKTICGTIWFTQNHVIANQNKSWQSLATL